MGRNRAVNDNELRDIILTIRATEEIADKVKRLARERGLAVSAYLYEVLQVQLDKIEA